MRYLVIGLVVLVIGVTGFIGYLFLQPSPSPLSEPASSPAVIQAPANDQPSATTTGRYQESTPEILIQTAGKRVLFFYASWCPTCRPADADFKANQSQIPADVTVLRVNYNDPDTDDAEKELAKKYGVTYQHTYVQIDQSGNQVTKWNGGKLAELLTNIK